MTAVHRALSLCAVALLVAGCAAATATPASPDESSGPPSASPSASPGTGCAQPLARRTADAYVAMLQAEHVAGARIFVSARYSDGNGMINDNAGDIDRAALVCLEQAAPDVTVVTGPEDPALPTKSATGIRELPEGPLITFGRLDGMDDHTTSINIDRGGGDVRGAQYDVTTDATGAVHVKQNGQMWIS